jgi:hypothetical protein
MFLLDVKNQQAFCRHCKGPARHLVMDELTLVWCPNSYCKNPDELHLYPDGTRKLHPLGALWEKSDVINKILGEYRLAPTPTDSVPCETTPH